MNNNETDQTLSFTVLTPCGALEIEYNGDSNRMTGDKDAIEYFNLFIDIGIFGFGGIRLTSPPAPDQIDFINGVGGMCVVPSPFNPDIEIKETENGDVVN
jgi:hypothetical protein